MHKQRIAIISCAGAGALGTFLPWIHAPFVGTITGTAGDGWITLALFIPALVLGLMGATDRPRTGGALWGGLVPALLASLLGLWKIIDLKLSFVVDDNPMTLAMARAVSIGIGLYAVLAAGIVMTILALKLGDQKVSKRWQVAGAAGGVLIIAAGIGAWLMIGERPARVQRERAVQAGEADGPGLANMASRTRVQAINRMNEGIRRFDRNDITGAVKALQEAIRLDPAYAAAHHTLGQLYKKQSLFDQAETAFKEAITKMADEPKAEYYYDLGAVQTAQGDVAGVSSAEREARFRAAIGSFEEALKLDPQQHKAHYRMGTLYEKLDMPKQADAAYRKTMAVNPSYSPAFVSLGNMYIDNGDTAAAMAVLQEGVKLNKDDPRMWNGLGRAYFELRRMQESIDAYAKAKALDPEGVDALYGLGMAYAELRQVKEASENLSLFIAKAGADTRTDLIQAAQDTIKRMASPI